MRLQHTIRAVVRLGEQSRCVAECVEIPVATQGATLVKNVGSAPLPSCRRKSTLDRGFSLHACTFWFAAQLPNVLDGRFSHVRFGELPGKPPRRNLRPKRRERSRPL